MLSTSILIFIMGKIRFQPVRNNPVIPTTCRTTQKYDQVATTARLRATIAPGSGQSPSASCYVILNRRPAVGCRSLTCNVAGDPTAVTDTRQDDGCEAAPMDFTFARTQFSFRC